MKFEYVTICSVFILYEIEVEKQKKKKKKFFFFFFFFWSNWEFLSAIGKKNHFLAFGMGPNFGPKIG